jgi:hypothetical protein
VGYLLVGWDLRPCNWIRKCKLDRTSRVEYLLVGFDLQPCNKSRRDKLDRKGRVGCY